MRLPWESPSASLASQTSAGLSALPHSGRQSLSCGLLTTFLPQRKPSLGFAYFTTPNPSSHLRECLSSPHCTHRGTKTPFLSRAPRQNFSRAPKPPGEREAITQREALAFLQHRFPSCLHLDVAIHTQQPSSWRKAHRGQAGTWKQQFSQVEQL